MNALFKSRILRALAGMVCALAIPAAVAETPAIVGQLIGNGMVQVTSAGLTFNVDRGHPYLLFAGDIIRTANTPDKQNAAQDPATAQLIMDSVGTLAIAPNSEIMVDRVGDRYQIEINEGQLAYSLQDSADIRITTVQGDLSPGGQSGALVQGAVATLGNEVMLYGHENSAPAAFSKSDNTDLMEILGGELIYSGPAKDSKIPLYAQLGAPTSPAPTAGGTGGATGGSFFGGFSTGGLAAIAAGFTALIAAVINKFIIQDDEEPASPVQ
ncbi:MAG: hypothetical protein R3F53_10690 [Gammaproteobacteria bacterium]